MKQVFVILLLLATTKVHSQKLELSTKSDSAIYYYYQGWEQVLDYGHFSKSEDAYRKMHQHDPEFLVGLSLLVRITMDTSERIQMLRKIEQNANEVKGDERLLLNLFTDLIKLYSYRERGLTKKLNALAETAYDNAESTLALLAEKYPDDIYYKSEYIEFIHRNSGAQAALDALSKHFPEPPPFMFGYTAQLQSELGQFDEALKRAKEFEQLMKNKEAPYVFMVYAKIYKEKGNNDQALDYAQEALKVDPGHILAKRMVNELSSD
ncbi:MAG: tetratricopeptide repeat protein [Cyclobacteriaceae bacterium]